MLSTCIALSAMGMDAFAMVSALRLMDFISGMMMNRHTNPNNRKNRVKLERKTKHFISVLYVRSNPVMR